MTQLSRRDVLRLGAAGVAGLLSLESLTACGGSSGGGPPSSLDPKALRPFKPGSAGGSTGLPSAVAWASTADSEFFRQLGAGMQQAATRRGLRYLTATSGNDPGKHVDQMNDFLRRGVGSMAMQPLNPDADSLVLQRAIDKGVCAQGIITAPSTMQGGPASTRSASTRARPPPTTSRRTWAATRRCSTSTSTPRHRSSRSVTPGCSRA